MTITRFRPGTVATYQGPPEGSGPWPEWLEQGKTYRVLQLQGDTATIQHPERGWVARVYVGDFVLAQGDATPGPDELARYARHFVGRAGTGTGYYVYLREDRTVRAVRAAVQADDGTWQEGGDVSPRDVPEGALESVGARR